jgi:3',5'-cyclic-AMP phosphodiesterase
MDHSPLYFVHITDTHLNAPGKEGFLKLDTTANLREILTQVRGLSFRPAFVVISGDLAHEGDAEDYRFIREMLDAEQEALGAPVLVALGNHDHRAPFHEGYFGQAGETRGHYFVQAFDGLRVFVLDSNYPGHDEGLLDADQLAWLKAGLAAESTPALLVVHHPPHTNSFFTDHTHLLTNADTLAEAIAGAPVAGILSGHIHFNSLASFAGVLSAAGQGAAFGLDSTDRTAMRLINAYGYSLGIFQNGALSVQPVTLPSDRRELMRISFEDIMRARENHHAERTAASD